MIDAQRIRAPFPRALSLQIPDVVFPPPHPYLYDPVGWAEDTLGDRLTSYQKQIMESVRDHRLTAVQACHEVGKTFTVADIVGWWLDVHPPGEAFVVTTAPTTQQVEAVLWRELGKLMHRSKEAGRKLAGRITMDAKWYFPIAGHDELVAYGRKPANHDAGSFSGIHARYVLVVIDEAGNVPRSLYDAADSLAGNRHARIVAIGNPDDAQAYFHNICSPGTEQWDNVMRIHAFMSPNFTADRVAGFPELQAYMETMGYAPSTESVPQRLRDVLVQPEATDSRLRRWGSGSPVFASKVLGLFSEISDRAVWTPRLVQQCYENDLPGMGLGVKAFDIAEEGGDRTVGYWNRDGVLRWLWDGPQQELPETTAQIEALLRPLPQIPVWIDANGSGSGVYGPLARAGCNVLKFKGSERAFDAEAYGNRRAEAFYHMKHMAETRELDLAGDDVHADDLRHDLLALRWKVDSGGRIILESKKEMAARGIKSTDQGDAASMACQSPAGHEQAAADLREALRNPRRPSAGLTGDLLKRAL